MIRSPKLRLPLAAVACLLPLLAPGESHLASTGQGSERSVATARVMFKIVIPEVLSMDFAGTEPHRMQLHVSGHKAVARFQSCTPTAAEAARGVSCTVSTP